jgi:hypothetical protein
MAEIPDLCRVDCKEFEKKQKKQKSGSLLTGPLA